MNLRPSSILRWTGYTLLIPIVILLMAVGAIYIPFVQRWAKGYVEESLSEVLGMDLRVGHLGLRFPSTLVVEDLYLIKPSGDTLTSIGALRGDVALLPLIKGGVLSVGELDADAFTLSIKDSLGLSHTYVGADELYAKGLYLDLGQEDVRIDYLMANRGRISYHSRDTVPSTDTVPTRWRIDVGYAQLSDTDLSVHLPYDSLHLDLGQASLELEETLVELEQSKYQAKYAQLNAGALRYAKRQERSLSPFFDHEDIRLSDLKFEGRDVYNRGQELRLDIKGCSLQDASGLRIQSLSGRCVVDSLGIELESLETNTNQSHLLADLRLPWSVLRSDVSSPLMVDASAQLSLSDLQFFTQTQELYHRYAQAVGQYPSLKQVLEIEARASGSLSALQVDDFTLSYGEDVYSTLSGNLTIQAFDEIPLGDVELSGRVRPDAMALLGVLLGEQAKSYSIPRELTLTADVASSMRGNYLGKVRISDTEASLSFNGSYSKRHKTYQGDLVVERLRLSDYLLGSNIGQVSATGRVDGRGYDLLDLRTQAQLGLHVSELELAESSLQGLSLDASLQSGQLSVALNSDNPSLNVSGVMDGLLSDGILTSSIYLDASEVNLPNLGLHEWPAQGSLALSGELRSDMKQMHQLSLKTERIDLEWNGRAYRSATPIALELSTSSAESHLKANSGDLSLQITSPQSYQRLLQSADTLTHFYQRFVAEIGAREPMTLRLSHLLHALPIFDAQMSMGRRNFLTDYLADQRLAVGVLNLNLQRHPTDGLRGHLQAFDIRQDTLRLDTLSLDLRTQSQPLMPELSGVSGASDSLRLNLSGRLSKKAYRGQRPLHARLNMGASLQEAAIELSLNRSGNVLADVFTALSWDGAEYNLSFPNQTLILAGNSLSLNPNHLLRLDKSTHVLQTDLDIRDAQDKSLIKVLGSSLDSLGQEVRLSLSGLDVERFHSLGIPDMGGLLSADLVYTRLGDWSVQPTLTGDISVQDLRFEDKKLGHIASALFYEPRSDDSHYLLAELSYDGLPALNLDAVFYPKRKEDTIEGNLGLTNFPLDIANPFLSAYNMTLTGRASGQTHLVGPLNALRLNGEVKMPDTQLGLRDIGVTLQTDSLPIRLADEKIYFDHYALRSGADARHPIYIDGSIDLSRKRWLETALSVKADELLLMNTTRSHQGTEMLYGKLLTSANLNIRGPLDAMRVRGSTSILGGTNCVYVMKESPLDATDRLSSLVSFVDFADTLFVHRPLEQEGLGGLDVSLRIDVDPAVRFGVDLTEDGKDYMKVEGGGTLQFTHSPYGEMRLTGRYDMKGGGTLRYTLPVVGAKVFNIEPTGYLRFSGDIANPYIQFKASQSVRASVGRGSDSQKVGFEVSILAQNSLENIDLQFDLLAPENLAVSNELSTMTQEERGKQALGLLASGVYLGTGSLAGALSFENTLSSLIQSQINSATGSLLHGTDLSIGMETGDGLDGLGEYTNYTYNFSRRFYNDRIRITVGGKIQSGSMATNQERSLIDNVSLEYQIDQAGNQSAKLYHKRVTNDALEGEHTETGATYIIRRRLQRLRDLFRFKLGKKAPKQ